MPPYAADIDRIRRPKFFPAHPGDIMPILFVGEDSGPFVPVFSDLEVLVEFVAVAGIPTAIAIEIHDLWRFVEAMESAVLVDETSPKVLAVVSSPSSMGDPFAFGRLINPSLG